MIRLLYSLLFIRFCAAEILGPLSDDFQQWLSKNGYQSYDFVRGDYGSQGSYGGKAGNSTKVKNTPVIFIHGNSDAALHVSKTATGWTNSIQYFLDNSYTQAELYATSWGDTNTSNAVKRTHNCRDLLRLRRFVLAVLDYTGAPKVSLITHSMGVTLGRKLIKGGAVNGNDGSCNLGTPLTSKIDVFLGLAGGNYGLCNCEGAGTLEPTCNKKNGFWPGDSCGLNTYTCGLKPLPFPCNGPSYSSLLMSMNTDNVREASLVFSAWSEVDDLILYGDQVWGRPTSLIPSSNGKVVYTSYTHMQTKENTAADQYTMVVKKTLPSPRSEIAASIFVATN
ncbi:triacylglycerol lipase [Ancylostoma caninum]|uniref:Triacylglycerol lipase n=1 Tax=Ancylostoma caninum TaxID=29170 RepID=A0A368FD47_ANCCA|nr:triacylglycerol lipase [Ancylostoma caninum]